MTALEQLIRLAPPPRARTRTVRDWAGVEDEYGLRLPPDYKQLVETYGPGAFGGFLWAFYPGASERGRDLIAQWRWQCERLREVEDRVPWNLATGREEIRPWAADGNGNEYWWCIGSNDDPATWTIAVREMGYLEWWTHPTSTVEFLLLLLSRKTRHGPWPDDFPQERLHDYEPLPW